MTELAILRRAASLGRAFHQQEVAPVAPRFSRAFDRCFLEGWIEPVGRLELFDPELVRVGSITYQRSYIEAGFRLTPAGRRLLRRAQARSRS